MNQNNNTLSFEASYTLDMISLLDLLFLGEMGEDVSFIRHLEEQLSESCEKSLRKVRKSLPKGQSLVNCLIPLITADQEFNELRLMELLQSPKYLITQLKKHPNYQWMSPSYKKFLQGDLEKIMLPLRSVVMELERLSFKTYWLEQRLPLINQKLKLYQQESQPLEVMEKINHWLYPQQIRNRCVYVLSFELRHPKYLGLINDDLVCSIQFSTDQIIDCLVEPLLESVLLYKRLKSRVRMLKQDRELLRAYKYVKADYQYLGRYLEFNVKLAYQIYLKHQLGICKNPYDYLGRYEFGTCKIAALFYHYMKNNPKLISHSVDDYLIEVVEQVELNQFNQRFMTLMNQVL